MEMSFWYRNGVCSNNRHSHKHKIVRRRLFGGVLVASCALGMVAQAQDRLPPGLAASFDVQQRLEYSDNPDLDANGASDFFGRTVLGFGLDSIRTVDSFFLNLGTDIEEGRADQDSINLTNTFGTLGYTRDTRNARAAFNLRYAEADASSNVSDEDFDLDGDVINQTDGTRRSLGYGLEGALGREAPIGASFRWNYNRIDYSGTSNTNQRDNDRDSFNGQVDFRISPLITTSLTMRYEDFNVRGDGVDRETLGFGWSARLEASRTDVFNISLSYDTIERTGAETATNEGLSGSVDWTREVPDGSLAMSYASNVSTNDDGRRSFLSASRTMVLPRGSLSLTLGLTGAEAIGRDPLVQANYSHTLPTGQISLGLSQTVRTDTDNNEEISTSLSAGYSQQINSLSSLGINLSFFNRNELQENDNDGQRLDVSVSYRYALTRDWGVVSGVSHRFSTEDRGEDRSSNTVFVGLDRNFSWRP
jgi:hypothetical protein